MPAVFEMAILVIEYFLIFCVQASFSHTDSLSQTHNLSRFSPKTLKILSPSRFQPMPTVAHEHGKHRRPRIKLHPATQKPNENDESREPLTKKMPDKKKMSRFLKLKGLGCGGFSSTAPAVEVPVSVRPVKKKKKKKQSKNRGSYTNRTPENVVPNVCCTPPGIGFTYDVAPSTSANSHRRNHRQQSDATRRAGSLEPVSHSGIPAMYETTFIRSNISDVRQYTRLRHRSPGGVSEIVMFHNPLLEGNLDGSDRYGDWRLNVDFMSYEELVELSDKIGYVGAGLQEEEILNCLKRPKPTFSRSFSFKSKGKDWKCSICQEECKREEELGRLECGHYHHIHCIKQWLLQKNVCPVCKTAAKSGK